MRWKLMKCIGNFFAAFYSLIFIGKSSLYKIYDDSIYRIGGRLLYLAEEKAPYYSYTDYPDYYPYRKR